MNDSQGRGLRAEARIARVAAAQHGVFSRAQALASGFSVRMIDKRVMQGRWIRADFAVYRPVTTAPTWHQVLMAACLAGPALASHRAGARIWSYPPFLTAAPEVASYRHRRRRTNGVIWHETRFLEARDATVIDGIPVTSATRTIIDLSTVATVSEIEIALDNARHRGLTDADRVAEELERMGRPFGTRRIREVLALKSTREAPGESPLETRTAMLLRGSDLPRVTPQFEVVDDGHFVGRVDFAWPAHRVALEVDGFAVHGDRAAWERDQARRSRLAAAGWRVQHVTHQRLKDPDGIIEELRKSLVRSQTTQ
ncbi:MAG: hypothetical protein JWL73_916 [Actinomycetia bacterium]|nr:hypothetical protein [Actinomycetes bacterium]